MITGGRVRFQSINDQYALTPDRMRLAVKVLGQLRKNFDWPQIPDRFLFVTIPSQALPRNQAPNFNVKRFYELHRGVQGPLAQPEIDLCSLIQEMVGLSEDGKDFKDFIARTFEQYVLEKKRSRYGNPAIYENANVEIRGVVVDYLGRRTIDIGVDKLIDDEYVEMCECCLTVFGISKWKDTQIGFYAECFKEIRKELGVKAKLRLELIAADSNGKPWNALIIPYLSNLKKENVNVVGVSYWPDVEYTF